MYPSGQTASTSSSTRWGRPSSGTDSAGSPSTSSPRPPRPTAMDKAVSCSRISSSQPGQPPGSRGTQQQPVATGPQPQQTPHHRRVEPPRRAGVLAPSHPASAGGTGRTRPRPGQRVPRRKDSRGARVYLAAGLSSSSTWTPSSTRPDSNSAMASHTAPWVYCPPFSRTPAGDRRRYSPPGASPPPAVAEAEGRGSNRRTTPCSRSTSVPGAPCPARRRPGRPPVRPQQHGEATGSGPSSAQAGSSPFRPSGVPSSADRPAGTDPRQSTPPPPGGSPQQRSRSRAARLRVVAAPLGTPARNASSARAEEHG